MDDAGFREYLKWNGANSDAGRNSRVHAVRKIESSLKGLGFDLADLDEAYRADGFKALRAAVKALRTDALAGGQQYRVLMPESENPKNRLASWNSWLAQYGRFLESRDKGPELDERFIDGMEQLRAAFNRKMPDFEGFTETEGPFWESEKKYKIDAHGKVISARFGPRRSDEECGSEVYKLLSQSSAQGLPLSWRTRGEVESAPPALRKRFYECVARLARLQEDHIGPLEAEAHE